MGFSAFWEVTGSRTFLKVREQSGLWISCCHWAVRNREPSLGFGVFWVSPLQLSNAAARQAATTCFRATCLPFRTISCLVH